MSVAVVDQQLHFGARYYNPVDGRFTQQDPTGQGPNLYNYADANPTSYVDPAGTSVACTGTYCVPASQRNNSGTGWGFGAIVAVVGGVVAVLGLAVVWGSAPAWAGPVLALITLVTAGYALSQAHY